MAKLHFEFQQGSIDWHRKRTVIPTSSNFARIMTPKRMQMADLALGRLGA